jgi:cytochrome c oxidase subunit 2
VKQRLPEEPHATVRVIGQQWAWSFVHPGPDGKLDTADDIETVDELHIEVDQPYIYELTSRDVLHNFSVPVFRLKQDAIPGRVITGWFEATKTGTYDIQCAEICGIGHGLMPARIVIESAAEHTAWMADRASSRVAAAGAAPALVAASTGAVSAN